MKSIYRHLQILVEAVLLAKRSNYPFSEKLEIFRILVSNHIKNTFFRRKEVVTQQIFGYQVSAYSYQAIRFLFKEIFLAETYQFETPNNSPVIIDCGANIGFSILYFEVV